MRIPITIVLFLCIVISYAQPYDRKEMRAVWIATVKNLDFPSNKLLSVEEQKKEYIKMLDYFSEIGINAIMFQVRPAADAFYASKYELWSEWLTGKQGQAPDPYYDPLEFYIEEAHQRNIEFHAWINPFRAIATIEFADIAENHITNRKPEWFFTYDIHKYFDPGIPEVRDYITDIIVDIVSRYDIDGIHFDDYFYPYPVKDESNRIIKIPDDKTYQTYNPNSLFIDEWRRENLTVFIKGVHDRIKEIKPYIAFGVGPSGIWRNQSQDPEGSDTRGFAHYDYLYSDVLKWLRDDYIDYVAPQLYWAIGNKTADYEVLVKWWSEHTYGKQLYIGQAVYLSNSDATSPGWRDPNQLIRQIKINRGNPNVSGSIFYKAKAMMDNPMGFCDSLKSNYYKIHVGTPDFPWPIIMDTAIVANGHTIENHITEMIGFPRSVYLTNLGTKSMLSWDKISSEKMNEYRIYKFSENEEIRLNKDHILKKTKEDFIFIERKRFQLFKKEYTFLVTVVDKLGKETVFGRPIKIRM
jgi:uncharacterized lipoprotein YddW (UPF0748 family)